MQINEGKISAIFYDQKYTIKCYINEIIGSMGETRKSLLFIINISRIIANFQGRCVSFKQEWQQLRDARLKVIRAATESALRTKRATPSEKDRRRSQALSTSLGIKGTF